MRLRVPTGFALLILAFVLFLGAASAAYGQEAPASRVAYLAVIDAPGWSDPTLIAKASTGGKFEFSNCNMPLASATLVPNGSAAIDGWSTFLCGEGIRVVKLTVPEGVSLTTENVYLDGQTVVEIPELPAPLAEDSGSYRFAGIRNFGERSTFIGLISDGPTRAQVTFYDGDNNFIGHAFVGVDGFTWFETPFELHIGSAVVENIGSGVGPAASGNLFAVAFAGYRNGGSPRVISAEVFP